MKDLWRTQEEREQKVIDRIREFEPAAIAKNPNGYFVAFSGGKDSIVVLDLVRRAGVQHEAHYHITTVDPPELVRFIRDNYPDVIRDRPKLTMWQLIAKKGMPPTRLSRFCCEVLKEYGGSGQITITGIRWQESNRRAARGMMEACTRSDAAGKTLFHPIIDWTEAEVWSYIRRRGLAYPSLYDEGWKRIGCIGCPMAGRIGQIRAFARWPKFKAAYIRAFQRAVDCAKGRTYSGPFAKWTSGQAMFDWWIGQTANEAQPCPLFQDNGNTAAQSAKEGRDGND